MTSLKTFQEELKNLLVREDARAANHLWKGNVPERLGVYKNNIRSNWTDTLEHDFVLTQKQFTEESWNDLLERYFQKHPPKHWELNTSMTPFVSFVKAQKIKPYVKELADYEWRDLEVFIDRSVVRRESGVSNPTVRVSVYHHQIFNWVQAGAPENQPPDPKPEVLIFYRDSKNTCHIREADPLMLLMLDHYRTPGAQLSSLEPVRRRLLPANKVVLESVLAILKKDELILL